jgi:hypothetical protein
MEVFGIDSLYRENLVTIEQVSCLTACQQCRMIAGRQLMYVWESNIHRPEIADRLGISMQDIPQRLSEHEIQIHFEIADYPDIALVAQTPFSTGVFVRHLFGDVPFPG